jgi:DNA-binding MarR family transcriptional regulator/GNAT superfamily N-acetyltransferase
MHRFDRSLIDGIRSSSRQMVRELGFMQTTLAATNYPASAVHTIMEVGTRRSMTAAEVTEFLGLEKSSVSRMLRKLIDAGELQETASEDDGRVKNLALTPQGRKTLAAIEAYGRKQVSSALENLSLAEHQTVSAGLAAYARALSQHRTGHSSQFEDVQIEHGYRAGVIGRITEMHANFYARHAGFGQFFESQVAAELAEFAARLGNPRNGLWVALQAGRIVGSVAIDGEDTGNGNAHLRWFIVDDGIRGSGIGRKLLTRAVDFCDRAGFTKTHLWTFDGLHAARRLYEANGFKLAEERRGKQWGEAVTEQLFARLPNLILPPHPARCCEVDATSHTPANENTALADPIRRQTL